MSKTTVDTGIVVLISARAEWKAIKKLIKPEDVSPQPFGETFIDFVDGKGVVFFQGGWGKVSAAASTQYVIDRFRPERLVNLGTCGGFPGKINRGETILVDETLIYDIEEQMGDAQEALSFYRTPIDLSWMREPLPAGVRRGRMVSADRDIRPGDVEMLKSKYGASAGDWESGAIAWVANRNGAKCLILRIVSDLVTAAGSETYGDYARYEKISVEMMGKLLKMRPFWAAQ